ncbi:PhoH family protein [bacterium]|nr:PhoH family protein [candidate division CSSED10-310 bacterium]
MKDLQKFYGCFDEHLGLLEQAFDISISAQGPEIRLKGSRENVLQATKVLAGLEKMASEGFDLTREEFQLAIRNAQGDSESKSIRDLLLSGSILTTRTKKIYPKTPNQKQYIDTILQHDLVFSIGPAGTGKTYLAVAVAITYLLSRKVSRILLVRPAVEAGESLGFLPGDMYQKVNPYLRPLYDALYDMLEVDRANRMVERGVIEVAPIAYMRGRTLNDSFIIMDEAQNTTPEQMKMFLTRLGFNAKTVVTGDITQIDLPTSKQSGLIQVQKILKGIPSIRFIYFDRSDVVRCRLVQEIVEAYERMDRQEK